MDSDSELQAYLESVDAQLKGSDAPALESKTRPKTSVAKPKTVSVQSDVPVIKLSGTGSGSFRRDADLLTRVNRLKNVVLEQKKRLSDNRVEKLNSTSSDSVVISDSSDDISSNLKNENQSILDHKLLSDPVRSALDHSFERVVIVSELESASPRQPESLAESLPTTDKSDALQKVAQFSDKSDRQLSLSLKNSRSSSSSSLLTPESESSSTTLVESANRIGKKSVSKTDVIGAVEANRRQTTIFNDDKVVPLDSSVFASRRNVKFADKSEASSVQSVSDVVPIFSLQQDEAYEDDFEEDTSKTSAFQQTERDDRAGNSLSKTISTRENKRTKSHGTQTYFLHPDSESVLQGNLPNYRYIIGTHGAMAFQDREIIEMHYKLQLQIIREQFKAHSAIYNNILSHMKKKKKKHKQKSQINKNV